ncbi:MAG: hypothetical protein HZA49_09100 [Planctomycetes bacterium]|nr:hypothetical protein [Planctomycetota bacterium]
MQQIKINPDITESDLGLKVYKALMQGACNTLDMGLYVSSMKLLLSAVDTMAFLETGNNRGNEFKQWLNKYVNLSATGVTVDELWEHRNALLHMTALDSDKVREGWVVRLIPYKEPATPPSNSLKNSKFYSIDKVYCAIANGLDKFIKDVELNKDLKELFESNWSKIVYDEPSIVVKA